MRAILFGVLAVAGIAIAAPRVVSSASAQVTIEIPMLMLFRHGEVVAQQAGAMNASTLRPWIRQQIVTRAA